MFYLRAWLLVLGRPYNALNRVGQDKIRYLVAGKEGAG